MRVLVVIIFLIGSVAESLKLYRVHVPHYKLAEQTALLECDFDLGNTRLYAVKWYKDNEEFFSYVARFKPPIRTHKVEGVNVVTEESDSKGVFLKGLDLRSTGVYRCEVSAEAPSFLSVHGEGRMTVVHLPTEGPQITGNLQDEYEVGDILDLNCTSSKSFPPAKISWYINDLPVEPFPYVVSSPSEHDLDRLFYSDEEYSLMVTSLRLRLRLSANHFGKRGAAKVLCVASISTLFWQDRDEKILGGNSGKKTMTTLTSSDNFRFDSPTSTSSRYTNIHKNLTPSPFIFNSTALVTVRGSSPSLILASSKVHVILLLILSTITRWLL